MVNLGLNLGNDLTIAGDNSVCGDSTLLTANVTATSYKWYKDGVEISQKEVEKINPSAIDSIEVIKGKAAKEMYSSLQETDSSKKFPIKYEK